MSAIDPQGNQTYWFHGLPFEGVLKSGNLEGTQTFWFNGLAGQYIYPPSAAPATVIKDIIGTGVIPFAR